MDAFRIPRTYLLAILVACTPLAAQNNPVVDTNAVTLTYTGSAGATTATVHVTGLPDITASGLPNAMAAISPNLQSDGSSKNQTVGVFTQNVVPTGPTSATVNVGTDSNLLAALARRGATSYNNAATLNICATNTPFCATVALSLNITNGGGVTITYNGTTVPSSGISVFAGVGGTASATLTLTSTTPTTFTASTTVPWISVGTTSGQLTGSQNIVLSLFASGLPNGPNSGAVIINAGGISTNIPVLFNVGTSSGITLSPNPLSFQYVTSTSSFTNGQSQQVTISGASSTATYGATVTTSSPWLQIGSGSSVTGQSVLTPLTVSVNPAAVNLNLAATYQGTIQITTSDGLTGSLTVNLTITSTPTTGVGSLTFNVATPGGAAPPSQQITISGSGTYNAFAGTNNCGLGWLQVSPSNGQLSSIATTLTVQVIPGSIGAGTCTGTISISTTGLLSNGTNFQTINVSMIIGGATGGGVVASPAALVFNVPPGATQAQSFIVNGNGTSFTAQAIGTNISISPTNGTTPAVVTVTVNSSSSSGTIVVSSPSIGTQNVTVTVNTPSGNILTANPASLTYIYQSGTIPPASVSLNATQDSAGSNLPFTITSTPAFVAYSVTSNTTPSSLGVGITTSQLAPGLNTGNIVITSNSAANSTLTIPITVLAPGATPGLVASPSSLNLSGVTFGSPVTQTVSLSGLSGTSFTASTISSGNWLAVSPTSGTSPATLTITANPLTLNTNTYNGTVTVVANNGTSITIPVTFAVSPTGSGSGPALSVTPTSVAFNYRTGDPAPTAQTVQIGTSGNSTSFTATPSASWITVSPASGNTPVTLSISLNTSLLSLGNQTGTVTIAAAGASGSPQTISVTANVTSAPVLTLNNTSTSFSYRTGDPTPPAQTIQVNSSGAPLAFTVSVSTAPWLTVTPTSGTTPATLTLLADPSKVQVGQSSATITINAAGSSQTVSVNLNISAPLPTIAEVHNGASNLTSPIAPGLIIVVTGSGMGPDTLATYTLSGDLFNTVLSNTRVLVGGFAAPMIYTSATQVAAIVPYEIAGRASTFVQVEYLGQRSNAVTVQVANTAPAIFTLNSSGTGPGAILNQDGSVNSAANPESANRAIVVFATGEGQTIPGGVDGKLADDPVLAKPVFPVTATINNLPANVQYYGAAPGLVAGVLQVNILVPPGATSGDVVIHVGGNDSQNGVTVAIR